MIYTNENWKPPVTYCEPNKAEPVVRCYECKYEEKCEREVMWENDSYRGILTFCSYGERRES